MGQKCRAELPWFFDSHEENSGLLQNYSLGYRCTETNWVISSICFLIFSTRGVHVHCYPKLARFGPDLALNLGPLINWTGLELSDSNSEARQAWPEQVIRAFLYVFAKQIIGSMKK